MSQPTPSGIGESLEIKQQIRDIIALSTLPSIWLGASPRRIAESLAAALYSTLYPALTYVRFNMPSGNERIEIVSVGRYDSDSRLSDILGPKIEAWIPHHDPEEILELNDISGFGNLRVAIRALSHDADFGIIAAAYVEHNRPTPFQHVLLNIAANQAVIAFQSARLLNSVNESLAIKEKAEKELQRQLAITRAVNRSLGEGFLMLSKEHSVVFMNPAAEALLGWKQDEVTQRDAHDLLHGTADPRVGCPGSRCGLARAVAAESIIRLADERFRRKDGTMIPVSFTTAPIKLDDEDTAGVVMVFHDMTERIEAEKQIKESEERFRLLVTGVKDYAIIMLDPKGFIISWNEGAERICGYRDREILGKHISTFDRASVDQSTLTPELREASVRGNIEIEKEVRRKDGTTLLASTAITALYDAHGMLRGFANVMRDVTEQRIAEEKIRSFNQELETRVHERTTELLAANKELESFSYSVSHDLRAPLRAINGYATLLKKHAVGRLEDQELHHLNIICDSASHMGKLIDALLNFSKLQRTEIKRTRIDMATLARAVCRDYATNSQPRPVSFLVGRLPEAHGDTVLIHQVWANLISNAVKFTGKRDAPTVEIGWTEEPGAYFVRDNGVGFDMSYAGKLFGVFQRLHNADQFEGTGIGLASTQRIVARHGGKIWADGEPDRGATFYFTVPTPLLQSEDIHEKTDHEPTLDLA